MNINDLKIAYDIVNNFRKYDTLSIPPKINKLDYKVATINGITRYEHGKDINSVKPNTLRYILFNLHNIEYSIIIDNVIALLYYWKIRKNNKHMFEKAYEEIINHYTFKNDNYSFNYKKGKCLYLIKIYIGKETLYKVGITASFNSRMANILSDIKSKYEHVSVSLKALQVEYTQNGYQMEKEILKGLKNDHKFYFDGHTESFKNVEIINIFNKNIKLTNKKI